MPTNFYIAIEGVIGVGKTTLARLIGQQIGAELLLEVFEENPFLSSFYADRDLYAFQTQIFFLLSRYRQQHNVIRQTLDRWEEDLEVCEQIIDAEMDDLFLRFKRRQAAQNALHDRAQQVLAV